MGPRKPDRSPQPDDQSARVDDTLVRMNRTRETVRKTVAKLAAKEPSLEEARKLAAEIRKKGPAGIQALFDCLFEKDSKTYRVALTLLSEMDDPTVVEKCHELLERPQLSENVRVGLLAIVALQADSHGGLGGAPPELSIESLLQVAEGFWEDMEMEEVSMMWRDGFISEPPEDRLAMLEALLNSIHPKLLGIARLEIALGDVKILQLLAQKLGQFGHPMAAGMLDVLCDHSDLVVRTTADLSQARWLENASASDAGDEHVLPRPRFHRAHMVTDEQSGHYSMVYAVKSPGSGIKFMVVLLDRWDRGVIDCWGGTGYSNEEFKELLANMAEDFADLCQERIPKRKALTLLHEAMELNVQRKHSLPLDFYIWIHLIENERFSPDPDVPPFGADCTVCGKPVRTGPRTPPPLVLGDLVVCHRCTKRPLDCPKCGGPVSLTDCLLTARETDGNEDLRCPHCFESFELPD